VTPWMPLIISTPAIVFVAWLAFAGRVLENEEERRFTEAHAPDR